ncbi:hypothetical protein F4604DRAFT_1973851 [Suillus subluteus]|nr:hypothetical protein F4604DRAFT_1973851 [Suillus subluteus]
MHLVCGLSCRAASLLLVCLRSIIHLSGASSTEAPISLNIPRDPRTVIGSFELEPRTRSYVCCPACFALHDTSPLPLFCMHRPTPTSRLCNTKLWKTRVIRGNQIQYPIRTYLHQDLKQWIARFLSRPGVEDLIDSAARPHEKEDMEDIWHVSTFCQFLGPDSKPFLSPSIREGRYVFSLGNKVAKQNVTVTGMYMNMYLPSTDQINHFLKLLVDDLLPFWDPAKYPDGRVIRIALIPIVCDLPAAKQVAGFSGIGLKFFCSYCLLPLHDIDNLDRSQWPPCGVDVHRKHACSYRDAPTLEERQQLLRLPYWDPISFTVVEYHCRVAWRMNIDLEDGETPSGEGAKSVGALTTGTFTALDACTKPILFHLCPIRSLRRASDMNDDRLHHVVLGQSLVTEIQKDMLRTELPTWVSRAPKALGSTAQGKLSADQWHAACTINMTITLAMLDNYMDLVTAVELGCMLVISPGHISQYDFYMQRYLENFKDLYKTLRLVPSHHISLHLGEFLCSFGPVHAWRAFAFERYNYLLQRENTNGKFGEIELTMMNHTCRVANFRTLIQEEHIRTVVSDMVDAYSNFAGEDRRGTRIRDVLRWEKPVTTQGQTCPGAKEVVLEEGLYSALLQLIDTTEQLRYVGEGNPHSSNQLFLRRKVLLSNCILIRGVSYRPSDFSHCDSNILFRSSPGSKPEAGRIIKIFIHHRYSTDDSMIEETFIALHTLIPLSDTDAPYDHYCQYPLAGGFLCYNEYHTNYRIIRPSGVICHYAKTPMHVQRICQPCVHVLLLDRLMKSTELPSLEAHNKQGINASEVLQ